MRVVVYELPHRPIALTAAFNAGRRYDPEGLECLAHIAEHMLVAGTKELPSKDKVASFIERLGGSVGATTGISLMRLNLSLGTKADFDRAVYLLDQLLVHSLYDEGVLSKELESVRQELAALTGNPSRFVQRRSTEQIFERTVLGGKLIDSQQSIENITVDDVRRYVRERLGGNNLTLVIAGGITLAEAVASLDKGLSLRNVGSAPSLPTQVEYIAPTKRIVALPYTSPGQVHFAYGFPSYSEGHPDNAPLRILATVLGGGRASSLSRILRYEAGLVYAIGATSSDDIGYGYWRVATGTNPRNAKRALELINGEFSRVVSGGITPNELAFAKDKIIKSAPIRMDSVGNLLGHHVTPEVYQLPDTSRIPGYLNAVAVTSLSDIERAAAEVIKPGASLLTMCGELPEDIDIKDLF